VRLALAAALLLLPCVAHAQDHEALHAVPIRYADRPLTLPEGSLRLDQSIVFRTTFGTLGISGPNALYAGLTDWLEIGVSWPWTRDPTFVATARIAHSSAVDLGLRAAVTTPAITTGDTDLVVSMPVVFRIAHVARISTGVSADLLLTQRVQPILRVPWAIAFSPSPRRWIALQGSVSIDDYRYVHADVGIVYGHTAAATALRPIGEIQLGTTFEIARFAFVATVGFSFWGTVNPVP